MKSNKRVYYFDYLKVLAIFLVVFNHTETRGFFLFAQQVNSVMFFPYMIFSIADKVAVPLLFMVSGALLLPRHESLRQLWKRRILKYLVIIIVFSFIRYLFELGMNKNQVFTLLGFFRYIYAAPMEVPYWFLYTYLAGLIMLPFLRGIARNLSEQEFKYLICLQIVIGGILPIMQYVFRMGSINLDLPIITNSIIFYMLIGHYLHSHKDKLVENKSILIVAWGLAIITLAITAWMVMYQYQLTGVLDESSSQIFFELFTPILAIAIFVSYQRLEQRVRIKKSHRILDYFSNAVLGVYLLEEMGRILLDPVYKFFEPITGNFIACWVWVFAVVLVTAIVTNILKLIPSVKKIL